MSATAPDRGKSPVGGKFTLFRTNKSKNAAVGVGCIAACLFLGIGINQALKQKLPEPKVDGVGTKEISQVTPPPQSPPVDKPAETKPPAIVKNDPGQSSKKDEIASGSADYVRMPAFSGEASFGVPDPAQAQQSGGAAKAAAKVLTDKAEAKTTTVDFKASTIEAAKAGPAIDLTYVMKPQLVPCALDTALDSTVAGAIECHTMFDVYSPMHVLLMPAHTDVMGTYKNDIQPGQNRLFSFVGSALTPEGIPVPLNSQIADGLGRAGIGATDVNHHYAERFGAAVLLTASDAALNLAQTMLSKEGQSSINIGGNAGGGIGGIASQILQSQIGIKDTISVKPGTIISIVVDHPVSFADALHVRTRE